ncbi:MAG: hypothetical protein LPD71_06985 [Shewanella sp.]|nr:hypothetical protein [Shewanella sp.]MCF1432018.1 hypothetical protein [Shewanella sp.]MCF1438487.1 hypothetical protein [Shewanella sp.]MCF1459468.1 hypothetical protein [Shewanella sp.]
MILLGSCHKGYKVTIPQEKNDKLANAVSKIVSRWEDAPENSTSGTFFAKLHANLSSDCQCRNFQPRWLQAGVDASPAVTTISRATPWQTHL